MNTVLQKKDAALINKALLTAVRAHYENLDKSGLPEVMHPLTVGVNLFQFGFNAETVAAGLLHDVPEDTSVGLLELAEIGFPEEVMEAVTLLTHDKKVGYFDYIRALKNNNIANAVKVFDLQHNTQRAKEMQSYAIRILERAGLAESLQMSYDAKTVRRQKSRLKWASKLLMKYPYARAILADDKKFIRMHSQLIKELEEKYAAKQTQAPEATS